MAVTALAKPTAAGGGTLNSFTPPATTPGQRSWLGVDPRQRMTAGLAKRGLAGYLGRDLTGTDINQAQTLLGRTFQSDDDGLTGEEYNRLLQEGARLTGGAYTPWSTTAPEGSPPEGSPGRPDPTPWGDDAPEFRAPELEPVDPYRSRDDFSYREFEAPDPSRIADDPAYRWRVEQGQRALEQRAAARGGTRGGNLMAELVDYGQGMASQEYGNAFDRALRVHGQNYGQARDARGVNVEEDRFAYGQRRDAARERFDTEMTRRVAEYTPRLTTWQERNRQNELEFDRNWQRELYGRDDAWRRHAYANDDAWRRYQLEEDRRRFLASQGNY